MRVRTGLYPGEVSAGPPQLRLAPTPESEAGARRYGQWRSATCRERYEALGIGIGT